MSPTRSTTPRRVAGWLLASALAMAAPALAPAKIDLVTLPGRDTTQVTIYESEDLTLVRETRTLMFRAGANEIQFSWANTLIDPTSLQIRVPDAKSGLRVLDAHYPANTQNTIVWTIEATKPGAAAVEISCFASGLTWQADYMAFANADETALRLEPNFTITNNSGTDLENAQTRLVVGEINLEEAIAELARRGMIDGTRKDEARRQLARGAVMEQDLFFAMDRAMPAAAPMAAGSAMAAEAKAIIKKAVSEYYLYTIEGTETLETGWGKQLPNPRVDEVPIELSYEYNPNKYGAQVVKFYKFKNTSEDKLGDTPLPDGTWYVSSADGRGGLRFEAATPVKYIPVGEDIELNLGSDGRLILENRTMSLERTAFEFDNDGRIRGHDTVEKREIELRNSNAREVPVKLTIPMGGADWEVTTTSDPFKKVDRNTIEWEEIRVPANGKTTISYTVTTRQGSRSKVN